VRIQTTTITAEQALTRDTVAVGVDAIVFWQVENAERAAIRLFLHRSDYGKVQLEPHRALELFTGMT